MAQFRHRNQPSLSGEMDDSADADTKLNPLHMEGGERPVDPSKPSSAYMESLKRARSSEHWQAAQMGGTRPRSQPGWRSKGLIAFLGITGVVLFLVGCSFYFDPDRDTTERKTGLDILLCSIIPLVPGLYGAFIWFGVSQGWHGYSMLSLGSAFE